MKLFPSISLQAQTSLSDSEVRDRLLKHTTLRSDPEFYQFPPKTLYRGDIDSNRFSITLNLDKYKQMRSSEPYIRGSFSTTAGMTNLEAKIEFNPAAVFFVLIWTIGALSIAGFVVFQFFNTGEFILVPFALLPTGMALLGCYLGFVYPKSVCGQMKDWLENELELKNIQITSGPRRGAV